MQSIRKTLNSHGSKLSRRFSISGNSDSDDHEQIPIILDQDIPHHHYSHSYPMAGDVVVKVDDAGEPSQGGKIWRESSYDYRSPDNFPPDNVRDESFQFQNKGQTQPPVPVVDVPVDPPVSPPSRLIEEFLHKQRASGQMSLDMDLEMDELQNYGGSGGRLPPVVESPSPTIIQRELKVSFDGPANIIEMEMGNDTFRRRHSKDSPSLGGGGGGGEFQRPPHPPHYDRRRSPSPAGNRRDGDGEVLRCTSNASFQKSVSMQRKSTLLKTKTKSRLMDPPEEADKRSGRIPRSGQIFSGFLGKKGGDDDDDDPFLDDDLPDEYKKNQFSVVILIEWLVLLAFIGLLITTMTIPMLRNFSLWQLKLWKWEVMILVSFCGRLVSGWVIRIIVFCIERNFLLRKKVLYFVYGVRKAVQNCVWLGLVLISWHLLFDKRVQRETKSDFLQYVTKVLVCFLVGTLIWLVKTVVVKSLASSFHVSTYFDRIQEALFSQFVIETLSGPPLIEIQRAEEEEERLAEEVEKLQNAGANIPPDLRESAFPTRNPLKSGMLKSGMLSKSPRVKSGNFSRPLSKKSDEGIGNGITIDHLHRLNPNNISAWNMKRLINMVRHGSLTTLDEQILDSSTGGDDTDNALQIRSENEAKTAAKKIFQNVARPGCRYIHADDFERFMRDDEALKTISLFEGASETRKISKSTLKNWVVNAFRERRALALTLNDTKTAVNKLHKMLNFVVGIIIMIAWLLILEIATTKFLLFLSSQVVLVAFIFGNTCKTVFEAIVFLFGMHPFDVGDRCEIDGIQMVVEEMNILTTVFLRYDNQKIMIPNSVLATKAIHNFYRSPDMGDAIEFCIHVATPSEKISQMKHRIVSYIDNKKEHWYPSPFIVLKDHEQLNMVRVAIWPTHRMNFQDMGERFIRRSILIEELMKIFRDLDIQYRLMPLDINVRALPTTSERLPASWATITS